MELVISAALIIVAIGIVWCASQLGLYWTIFALSLSLGALIYIILRQRAAVRDEHLYDRTLSVPAIRQPLTPMEYSYRSNLDIPFFIFESQNYGKKKPRTRVRGIPIDRFTQFELKTDSLLEEIQRLRSHLDSIQGQLPANSQSKSISSTTSTVSQAHLHASAEVLMSEAKPHFDTILPQAEPSKNKVQFRKFQSELRLPFLRPDSIKIRAAERISDSIYDEIGNVCGSCGGRLKNFQCVDRCDPLSQ